MTFINPLGIIGFLSLPIIIALHLLREPTRRYVVSHLKLWAFLDSETRGPRARNIPLTRILIADLWVAGLLTLAWIQPVISISLPVPSARHLVIFVDTTSSMRADHPAGTRFTAAQDKIRTLIESARPNDLLTILKFGRSAAILADGREVEREQVAAVVDALQVGEIGNTLPEALMLGTTILDPSLAPEFHVISDGNFDWDDLSVLEKLSHPINWHLIGEPLDNQAVTVMNSYQSDEDEYQLFNRFANFGSTEVSRTAVLEIDGEAASQTEIRIAPDSTVAHIWTIQSETNDAPREIRVLLLGDDGLEADDSASIGLLPGRTPRVALVADNPFPLQQAIQALEFIDLEVFTVDEYLNSPLTGDRNYFDLLVFRNFIPADLPEGLMFIVDPPPDVHAEGWFSLVANSSRSIPGNAVARILRRHPITNGIDFNSVRWGRAYELENPSNSLETLLEVNGTPLIMTGEINPQAPRSGQAVILLASLERGNFPQHPAFPILIANMVEYARNSPLPQGIKTSEPIPLPPSEIYQALQLVPPARSMEEWSRQWPGEWLNTQDPGFYRFKMLKFNNEVDDFSTGAMAGDVLESDLRARDWADSLDLFVPNPLEVSPEQKAEQIDLRPWLLGAALLLMIMEASLAWRR